MKVIMVNASDIEGGAARAAYRLHRALLAGGVDSRMVVQSKASDDWTVVGPTTKIQKALGKMRPTIDALPVRRYKNRTKTLFSPAWVPFSSIVDQINALDPDIVHLHWVAGGMMRVEDIARIKAPIVWSLHDNWAFTGGCHIMWDCTKYKESCGGCPRLGSSIVKDLSRAVFLRKQKTFANIKNITVVGLSNWLATCARESALFSGEKIVSLPNPIDAEAFSPIDKSVSRRLFRLPQDKKLVLFGALSATSDVNKGFKELIQALEALRTPGVELVVFGSGEPENGTPFTQKAHYMGRLHDDVTLRALYSAADVMVVPSRQEAFGQTASESMACGTPVVAFGTTGLLDIIDHKINGYLAKPFDVLELARGIDWMLQSDDLKTLASAARQKAALSFDYKIVAPKYIELYRAVLEKETP